MFLKGFPIRLSIAQRNNNINNNINNESNSQNFSNSSDSYISQLSYFIHQQKQTSKESKSNDKEIIAMKNPNRISQLQLQKQLQQQQQQLLQKQNKEKEYKTQHREKREKNQLKSINAIALQANVLADHIICRRAEILVRATYIITGIFLSLLFSQIL